MEKIHTLKSPETRPREIVGHWMSGIYTKCHVKCSATAKQMLATCPDWFCSTSLLTV